MIDRDEILTGLRKLLRRIDREIGVNAALQEPEMREDAERRRELIAGAIALLEK